MPKIYDGIIDLAGVHLTCAVIDDEAYFSTRAARIALGAPGLGRGYEGLPKTVTPKPAFFTLFEAISWVKPFIHNDLTVTPEIKYTPSKGGPQVSAFPALLIVPLIKSIRSAAKAGAVPDHHQRIADRADEINDALLGVAIVALIHEATGYEKLRAPGTLQGLLAHFLVPNPQQWKERFKSEFPIEICRLRGWPPPKEKNAWRGMGQTINEVFYDRMLPGLREEFNRLNPKNEFGRRSRRNHQFLSDKEGVPMLEEHAKTVMNIATTSGNWREFIRRLGIIYPKFGEEEQRLPNVDLYEEPNAVLV